MIPQPFPEFADRGYPKYENYYASIYPEAA
jgi:hypothetical protein